MTAGVHGLKRSPGGSRAIQESIMRVNPSVEGRPHGVHLFRIIPASGGCARPFVPLRTLDNPVTLAA